MVKKKTKNLQQLAHEVLEEKKKQKKVKKREKEEKKKMKGEKTKKPYTPKTHFIFAPSSSLSLSSFSFLPLTFFHRSNSKTHKKRKISRFCQFSPWPVVLASPTHQSLNPLVFSIVAFSVFLCFDFSNCTQIQTHSLIYIYKYYIVCGFFFFWGSKDEWRGVQGFNPEQSEEGDPEHPGDHGQSQ
jgi:hypothetical protein